MKITVYTLFILMLLAATTTAQTTEVTYQGRLTVGGTAANTVHDFEFRLCASETDCATPLDTIQRLGVPVSNGIFTVKLDFDSAFTGADRWLEIAVRQAGGGTFATLSPRQRVTSAPYSIKAANAASSDSLASSCVTCVTDGHILSLDGAKVTGTVSNAATATNVSGVVQIPNGGTGSATKNFVDLSTNQTIGGRKDFTDLVSVSGPSGAFSGNGSGLTNLNGANIAGGSVTSQQLSPDALPNSNSLKLLGSLRWDLLKGQATFPVGGSPGPIIFDGAHLWVAYPNTVLKIRTSDGAVIGSFTAGANPKGIAFDGTYVWLTNTAGSSLRRIKASDGSSSNFFVGGATYGIAYDGANLWVTHDNNPGTVSKVRASDGTVLATVSVGEVPQSIIFDGSHLWVACVGGSTISLLKLRSSDGAQVANVPTTGYGLAFDGYNVWATPAAFVRKIRASDGAILNSVALGFSASNRGVAFDGANIWVVNSAANSVVRFRSSDFTILDSFPVGGSPLGIAFDGTNMWTTNSADGSITRLPPAFPESK